MKFTVAIIGNDGSGKTTIVNRLSEAKVFPSRYLYMGLSTLSSNMALPTSHLARFFKLREYEKRAAKKVGEEKEKTTASHDLHHGAPERGSLWKTLRFANRMIEALWRQWLSWLYQVRGFIVLYDRHYFFDAAPAIGTNIHKLHWTDRLEFRIFTDLYPKPGLVVFLDAPAEVLFSRKGESTIKTLEKRRETILTMAERLESFVVVDAAQSLDKVYEDVLNHILAFGKHHKI